MTIISHKHRFIFICSRKTASTSIRATLDSILEDDDILLMNPENKDFQFNAVLDESEFVVKNRPANTAMLAKLTSSEEGLVPHLGISTVANMVGEDIWNAYFKFAVVRNPWDWFASLYFFIMHRARRDHLFSKRFAKIGDILAELIKEPHNYRSILCRAYSALKNVYWIGLTYLPFRLGYHKQAVELLLRSRVYQYAIDEMKRGDFYFRDNEPILNAYIRYEHLDNDFANVCQRFGLSQLTLLKAKTKLRDKKDAKDYRRIYTEETKRRIEQECANIIKHFNYTF